MDGAVTSSTLTESAEVARGVAVSAASQLGAKILHLALNVVSSLVLIRYMSPGAYGDYVLVITVTALLGLLSDFGFNKLAVREVTRRPDQEASVVGTVAVSRLGLAVVAALLVQAVLGALGSSGEVRLAAGVMSLLFVAEALLTVVVAFHVRIQQQYEAFVRVAGEALETGLILWLVTREATLVQIVTAPVVGGMLVVVLAAVIARRRYRLRVRVEPGLFRHLVREVLPIGPAMIIGVVLLKVDTFMLAALRPSAEVGVYGAAFQPIEYLLLAAAVLVNVVFPVMVRYQATDRERFQAVYRRTGEMLVAVFLPIPVLLVAVAPPLVSLVYGSDFAASAGPLRLLSLALVLMVVSAWQSFVLLAAGFQQVTLRYNAAALALAVVLNWALIPGFGYMGAATATLLTAAVTAGLATAASARYAEVTFDLGRLGRVVAATGLLGVTLGAGWLAGLTWWLAGAVAAATYTLWIPLLGVARLRDLRLALEGGTA